MFCVHCGKSLPDTANFCDGCGAPVPRDTPAQPMPQATDFRPGMPVQPAAQPARKRKILIAALALIAVLFIGIAVGLLFGGKEEKNVRPTEEEETEDLSFRSIGEATLSDYFGQGDWTYCSVSEYAGEDGQETTLTVTTSTPARCQEVWEDVCDLELEEVKREEWMWDLTAEAPWISFYVSNEGGGHSFAVLESGLILVSRGEEDLAFTGGERIFTSLKNRLPRGEYLNMETVFSEDAGHWNMVLLIYEDENDSEYGKVSAISSQEIRNIVEALGQGKASYGPLRFSYGSGCDSVRIIMRPADDSLPLVSHNINADGTGNVTVGDWTYGVSGALSTYDILIQLLVRYG